MKKLGFGCMRLTLDDPKNAGSINHDNFCRMVDIFLERGFNYFDTAYMYHKYKSETAVREALVKRHPRESFLLADKLPLILIKTPEDAERIFAEQFEKCGVEYFDYYLLHNLNRNTLETAERCGCFELIKRAKAEGKLRRIGFSYHDDPETLDKILTGHPEVEFVQIQLNYLDYESVNVQSRKCYEVVAKHGLDVIVMEPVKGGMLANPPGEVRELMKSLDASVSPSQWAIRFAAGHPAVKVVLSGMANVEQMEENTAFMSEFVPLSDKEQEMLAKAREMITAKTAVPCTACRYCVEGCPQNIAIPEYFGLYNAAKAYMLMPNQTAYYGNYTKVHGKAADCIGCRKCEEACPQHIKISEEMKNVSAMFDK